MSCLVMRADRLTMKAGVAELFEARRALRQMGSKRLARCRLVAVADRLEDRVMLLAHPGRMALALERRHVVEPCPLARHHRRSKRVEQPPVIGILRRDQDRAVKGEVLLGAVATLFDRLIERIEPGLHAGDILRCAPQGRKTRRLVLYADAQFENPQHLVDRFQVVRYDEKGTRRRIVGNEGAKTLARGDQPLGPQRRQRLAHDRAAHTGGLHDRLLGRQALAGFQVAGFDLRDQAVGQSAAQIGRLRDGVENRAVPVLHSVPKSNLAIRRRAANTAVAKPYH